MNIVALVLAAGFAALAVRSAVYWIKHHPLLRDAAEELLFAAFVTGRVGTWAVAAAMFVVFGTISTAGQPYTDEAREFSWLFIVFLALGASSFLAAWFLGARERSHGRSGGDDDPPPPGA
jgi:hypothetical protein